ncbi:UNVERIFIED_CONTAM: hypothetical protein GTU68_037293 [Idotea baltica]|nr:hypothetical protein [Idotea baltica]
MILMRRFEERAGMLYGMQKIRGFCHLYIGQEAVAAGIMSAINNDDPIITAYRDHALALGKGISANACMAELYGKETGCSKGKGGSMHFFSKEHAFYGGHGIVGAQIPMGAGIAFAEKYNETGKLCVTMFGDGAARQGALHETFNMAMTWKLPAIFVVENNFYAMGTSVERTSNIRELYQLGESYDMPSLAVDGMSCEAVHKGFSKAADHVRSGKGPYLIEVKTYRYKGHSMSDPQKYRTKEEVQSYKAQDPINDVKNTILKKKYATQKWIDDLDKRIKKEIDDCVEFAEQSDFPKASAIYEEVYIQNNYPYINH